jgi:integrase
LGQLNARDVRQFLAALDSAGVGGRTAQLAHAVLRAALEDAMREEIIPRNVARLVRGEDVDLDAGVLRVRRGLHRVDGHLAVFATESQRSERTVPLLADVVRVLRDHHKLTS